MRRLILVMLTGVTLSAFAGEATVKGYLVDVSCATEEGRKPGFGALHSKRCLQIVDCANSGYSVLTDDGNVIRFDKAGNEQAKKFLNEVEKTNDIKVNVTGNVNGGQITVSKIKLQ